MEREKTTEDFNYFYIIGKIFKMVDSNQSYYPFLIMTMTLANKLNETLNAQLCSMSEPDIKIIRETYYNSVVYTNHKVKEYLEKNPNLDDIDFGKGLPWFMAKKYLSELTYVVDTYTYIIFEKKVSDPWHFEFILDSFISLTVALTLLTENKLLNFAATQLSTFTNNYYSIHFLKENHQSYEEYVKAQTAKANEARWGGFVEKQRRRYLELYQQKQKELGKKPTIKSVANWIHVYHNEFDVGYEAIRDHLSQALRGNFENK